MDFSFEDLDLLFNALIEKRDTLWRLEGRDGKRWELGTPEYELLDRVFRARVVHVHNQMHRERHPHLIKND